MDAKTEDDDGCLPVQIAYDIKKEPDGSLTRSNVRWQDVDGNDLEPVEENVANAILLFQAVHARSYKKKKKKV